MNESKKNISHIGGLVGRLNGGKIIDSSAEGTIIINGSATNVGGLVGSMDEGEIYNSSANMRIIITEENVFSELRMALEQIKQGDEKHDLTRLAVDMENSVGEPTFNEKYKDFVANSSAHFTLLSPFISKLAEFIVWDVSW